MKNKKIGIFVGMLVIFATLTSVAGTMNISENVGEPFTDHNDSGPKNLPCPCDVNDIFKKSPPCPCDLNDDRMVNSLDAGLVKTAYGYDPSNPLYAKFDINDDGMIDSLDCGLVKVAYGPCPS